MIWTVYDVWSTLFDKFLISNENQQRFVVSFKKPVFERVRAAGAQPHPPPSFPWRFIFSPTLHPNNSTWINCRIVADLWYSYLTIIMAPSKKNPSTSPKPSTSGIPPKKRDRTQEMCQHKCRKLRQAALVKKFYAKQEELRSLRQEHFELQIQNLRL